MRRRRSRVGGTAGRKPKVSGNGCLTYRVLADGRKMFFRPEEVLAFDEVDEELSEAVRTVWIHLHRQPGDDQDEIRGHYCRCGRDWAEFGSPSMPESSRAGSYDFLRALPRTLLHGCTTRFPCAWRLDLPLLMRGIQWIPGNPRLSEGEASELTGWRRMFTNG